VDGLGGLIVIAVVAVIVVVAWRVFSAPGSGEMGRRAGRLLDRDRPAPPARQVTVDTLRPGDAVSFWDGDDEVVESVVECREELGGRTTTWRWVILSGGRVLETAPDENMLYTTETVHRQGTLPFDRLTTEPSDGGALKTFEARVRDGTVARDPVTVELEGTSWTVESTGTFAASFLGPPPRREVWRDISSTPADNVYFELHGSAGETALGIWTTHILLLEGRVLEDTDIQDLYPGQVEAQRP
jgi:hypothetical protein